MASDLIPHFKKRFGIEDMRQGYGTSETFRVFDEPESAVREGAVLGYPVKHLEVVLMDEEDRPVKEGEAGEICVRPREPGLIFCGYFKDPDRTVEAWRSMWHHTGDMAFKGEDGLYRFADRKKDYIRYKGRNMSMFEVEAVVSAHPAVKDVAAFGIQSAELESESELMISVILAEGQSASPEDLARFINQEAPYYFVPRYIDIVAELPRNDHGRLMKNDLRDRGVTDTTWDREATDFEIVRP
jgi:crotonobetaine/carnitine-CoA ligase